jgi:hypothetical protein
VSLAIGFSAKRMSVAVELLSREDMSEQRHAARGILTAPLHSSPLRLVVASDASRLFPGI